MWPAARLKKRSLLLAGHATSVALEPEFWAVLERAAAARGLSVAALLGELDASRGERPLASAARLAALAFLDQAPAAGSAGRVRSAGQVGLTPAAAQRADRLHARLQAARPER